MNITYDSYPQGVNGRVKEAVIFFHKGLKGPCGQIEMQRTSCL